MAITVQLCLATMHLMGCPNVVWAAASTLIAATVALGTGLSSSSASAERPAPSTLLHAYEHGADSAVWVTEPTVHRLDSEARAWSEEKAGGAFESRRYMSDFRYFSRRVPVASAAVVAAPALEVTVVTDV